MKTIFLTISFLFIYGSLICQTNESKLADYTWKGKKTVSQKGYVVLKSGKKLEGKISLKGSPNEIKSVLFSGEKEIDFPLSALQAYGLVGSTKSAGGQASVSNSNSGPVCDHNPELFTWRDMGEQMEKQIHNTKPRNGYVILRDGSRMEGELQLKNVDNILSEIKLKADKKHKFKPSQISNYGLMLTIGEITKNGEKTYNDAPRNFHPGSVTLKSGEVITGFVAFRNKNYINPNKPKVGFKYNGLFFAPTKDGFVKTYKDEELAVVQQSIAGVDLKYSPYEGGFVAENEMDNVSFIDPLKEFNTGVLTMANGSILEGKISKPNLNSVDFKGDNGIIKKYQASEIKRFDVTTSEGEELAAVNIEGEVVEEYFLGTTFWVYENPHPTTVNERRTNLAKSAANVAASSTSAFIISKDEEKNGYETNLDSIVRVSSAAELRDLQNAFLSLQGYNSSEELQDKSENETAKKYDSALSLAIAGKEFDITIYYEEIVFLNKKTKETVILYKKKSAMNEKMEGWLMGCYTFLSLEKKDQKKYYDIANIAKTAEMLDGCYE